MSATSSTPSESRIRAVSTSRRGSGLVIGQHTTCRTEHTPPCGAGFPAKYRSASPHPCQHRAILGIEFHPRAVVDELGEALVRDHKAERVEFAGAGILDDVLRPRPQ